MTNPNNAIGTNGAYGGRTSVNAFNDGLAVYASRGVLSGFTVSPDTGMKVVIGGSGTTRDVAVAEDNAGNRTTINNISGAPVSVTIPGAPASNSRIDLLVAYVENPPQGTATITDNYGVCGLIVVSGASAATPVEPDDSDIRTAITADGASGTTAYYVVLGSVKVSAGATDITGNMITQGAKVSLGGDLLKTSGLLNLIYPVGSIYMSVNNTSPATFLGGTWQRIQDRFILSAGTTYSAGSTGGSASHDHNLSDKGAAAIRNYADTLGVGPGSTGLQTLTEKFGASVWTFNHNADAPSSFAYPGVQLYGATDSKTTLPPYIAVYVWKRTA